MKLKYPYVVDDNKLLSGFIENYPDGEGIRKYSDVNFLGRGKDYESGEWYIMLECKDGFIIRIPSHRQDDFIY